MVNVCRRNGCRFSLEPRGLCSWTGLSLATSHAVKDADVPVYAPPWGPSEYELLFSFPSAMPLKFSNFNLQFRVDRRQLVFSSTSEILRLAMILLCTLATLLCSQSEKVPNGFFFSRTQLG